MPYSPEFQKERQVAEVRKKAEEDLLAQLKRQAAAHSQHLREVLSVQEEDYNHRLKMILGEGIAVERRKLESTIFIYFLGQRGAPVAAFDCLAHCFFLRCGLAFCSFLILFDRR